MRSPRPDRKGASKLTRAGRGVLFAACLAFPQMAFAAAPADWTNAGLALAAGTYSNDARKVLTWVVETKDNHGMPFMIVDKTGAQVFAFDAEGALKGAAPALLGLARGDDSPPGIGARALADIATNERITPAGRFVAGLGVNLEGHEILWVDYDAAISLHPVIVGKAADHRLGRLASTTNLDNRISFGCINVPKAFFAEIVRPLFNSLAGVVYILPETRSVEAVFSGAAPNSIH